MRKITYLILFFTVLVLSASCQGVPGMDGRDGRDGVGVIDNVLIDVPRTSWEYSNIDYNNYFFATVDMPEITKTAFRKGLIKVYRVYDFDKDNGAQIELPYVRLNEEYIGDDYWVFYTETVDYEFGVGTMTIYYTVSDFNYEIDESFVPEAMQFRCVIMY